MLQILPLFLLFASFAACQSSQSGTATGKHSHQDSTVASKPSVTHQVIPTRKAREVQMNDHEQPLLTFEYSYNAQGKVSIETIIDHSQLGESVSRKLYFYEDSLLKRTEMHAPDGTISTTWNFHYDAKGHLIKENAVDADGREFRIITYTRNANGDILEELIRNANRQTKHVYTYDERFRLTSSAVYVIPESGNPRLRQKQVRTYNPDIGPEMHLLHYLNANLDTIVTWEHVYDDEQRLVRIRETAQDGNIYIIREIGYDRDGRKAIDEGRKREFYRTIYFYNETTGALETEKRYNRYDAVERMTYYEVVS